MDFIKELGGSLAYTFHSHTEFCDGRAQMEAFAREAVRQNFTHYGFTPHSPIPIESPCNMHLDNVPHYFAEVQRIRQEYGHACRFYAGMEIDYLGEEWGPASEYFQTLPLDYSIGSVHFIPTQEGNYIDIDGRFESFRRKMQVDFHNDIRYVVETFYAQSHRMISAGGFDIIGHFDKIGHNAGHFQEDIEKEMWYRTLVDELIDHIIDFNANNPQRPITVEINTKAKADHNRIFPAEQHIPRLVKANVPIIVNSDAHVPALINSERSYALSLL